LSEFSVRSGEDKYHRLLGGEDSIIVYEERELG